MTTHSSDENVDPAPPLLASTLLELESDHRKKAKSEEPFQTGVKRLDANLPQTLWRGGKIIGIVSKRSESALADHLIATHLSALAPFIPRAGLDTPSTFIIGAPNTSIASSINNLLPMRLVNRSENFRIQLLNTVQLMPYFDFVGLSESFSEVSARLHDLRNGARKVSSLLERHILLVDGLCPALESAQRRSGLVQANALAASFLRSITHLSRSHPSLLILLNLVASQDARGGEELISAFSSPEKRFCGVSPGGMLENTLLAGIDTVVLLHDTVDAGLRDGDLVVEVVKDRVGTSLGQWVVWPNSG